MVMYILAALNAIQLQAKGFDVTIVTTNVGHLALNLPQLVTGNDGTDRSRLITTVALSWIRIGSIIITGCARD